MPCKVGVFRRRTVQHHAILIAQVGKKWESKFKIIHAQSRKKKGSVREDTVNLASKIVKGNLRRYEYEPDECKEPGDVIQEAKRKIGDFHFNIRSKNCEHFARECKTGNAVSYQAEGKSFYSCY